MIIIPQNNVFPVCSPTVKVTRTLAHIKETLKGCHIHLTKGRHQSKKVTCLKTVRGTELKKNSKLDSTICFQNKETFLTTPFSKTDSHHVNVYSLWLGLDSQAILASHFSRSWTSAEPASPLPPLALHSRNSTLRGSCANSKSLPFFPRWA